MKFKKNGMTLKFKITFLVLLILASVCAMLTYTSIYNNKGYGKLAIAKIETTSLPLNKAIETYPSFIVEEEIPKSAEIVSGDTGERITPKFHEIKKEKVANAFIRIRTEPIQEVLQATEVNFRNMQITFMIIIVILGGIITYIILSKFLNPLTKMTNVIENINHNNLDEEIKLPKSNDEIYRLSKSFNDMLDRIKSSFEMEKNFSASASHELKTPLAIMKSSIQVLKLSDKPTIEEYEENIEIMEQNIEKLIDIVNNLLLLTSNNIGLVEKIDIKEIIDKIILNYNNELENKNIKVINNIESCTINNNKSLINCVFENIINNAIKYNKNNGEISINLEKEKNNFKFIIEDTGIGISENNINNIFEPFFREDTSRSKEIKGNGLGLSLVKNILEKINGNILVESEKQKGTKVILTI